MNLNSAASSNPTPGPARSLAVNEIFLSLQGESTFAGLPCVFVRLAGCDLRCSYCDTAYAFGEGRSMTLSAIRAAVARLAAPYPAGPAAGRLPLVELTGGEPLLQPAAPELLAGLCDNGFTVLLETNGARDISPVDPRVRRILDLKCPASGESSRNHWPNLDLLRPTDEVKCVIATVEDYLWARDIILSRRLWTRCPILVSWASPPPPSAGPSPLKPVPAGQTPITRRELAERVLADALPARFQAQLHKIIWPPDLHGV